MLNEWFQKLILKLFKFRTIFRNVAMAQPDSHSLGGGGGREKNTFHVK